MSYHSQNITAATVAGIPAIWRLAAMFATPTITRGAGHATVDRAAFAAAIAKCADVAEKSARASIPILADVLITAKRGALVMKSTNMDIETAVTLDGAGVMVDDTLAFCVPVHTLAKLVKTVKWQHSSEITIDFDGGDTVNFEFGAGGLRTTLQCRPHTDFPAMAAPTYEARFDLFANDLQRALDNVAFTVSTEETRYYLNGVYMVGRDEGLTFVATDGHRLARYVLPNTGGELAGVILPASLVKLLQKRLKARGRPDWLSIDLAHNQITIRQGSETITSKLIDGTFPDYERVIPAGNDNCLTVDGAEFIAAVKQVQVISSDRGRAVKMEMSANRIAGVKLTVNNSDSGSATLTVPATYGGHESLEIGVNSQYLIDVISKVGEPIMMFGDSGSPIRIEDNADSAHTIVLMPMRI